MREFSEDHKRIEDQLPALEADRTKRGRKTANGWNDAIITVGTGYGFVTQGAGDRFVVTAAHCLPELPPCNTGRSDRESCYPALIGPLGGQQTVAAACCFADTICDIAVLGPPSGIEALKEFDQYLKLTEGTTPLSIAEPLSASLVWVPLSGGEWLSYVATSATGEELLLIGALDASLVEMAGAPIISDNGTVVGVLCPDPERDFLGASHPGLVGSLPRRLLRFIGVAASMATT